MSWPNLLTPVLFSGTGQGLYPLCDSTYAEGERASAGAGAASTSASSSDGDAAAVRRPLSKALLPLANRPVAAYALQSIVSALPDCRYAVLFAPLAEHADIARSLQLHRLSLPAGYRAKAPTQQLQQSSRTSSTNKAQLQTSSIDVHVVDGLKVRSDRAAQLEDVAASSLAGLPHTRSNDTFKLHLLPLGPHEKELSGEIAMPPSGTEEPSEKEEGTGGDFRRIQKLGTAELLRWAMELGKVQSDPLVLPIDLLNPYLPLTHFIAAHIEAGIGSIAMDEDGEQAPRPALTCMLYQGGAGDGTGKEREKEGPAKLLCAYSADTFKQEMGHCLSSLGTSNGASAGAAWASSHSSHRLLHLSHLTDAEEGLSLRRAVSRQTNKLRVSTNLLDSHVYIFDKRKLQRLLRARQELTSLREHVVPLLIKAGYQPALWEKAVRSGAYNEPDAARAIAKREEEGDEEMGERGDKPTHALSMALQESSVLTHPSAASLLAGRSTLSQHQRKDAASRAASPITCIALIHRLDSPSEHGTQIASLPSTLSSPPERKFVARANTVPTFLECNRWRKKLTSPPTPTVHGTSSWLRAQLLKALSSPNGLPPGFALPISTLEPPSVDAHQLNPSAQVSPDTILPFALRSGTSASATVSGGAVVEAAPSTADPSGGNKGPSVLVLGDKCALKKCIVGRGCVIGKGAKLTGCVLMQGARVGDNAKLDSVILCPGSTVGDRCNLKDCDVATGVHVLPDTQAKNEKITVGAGQTAGAGTGDVASSLAL